MKPRRILLPLATALLYLSGALWFLAGIPWMGAGKFQEWCRK